MSDRPVISRRAFAVGAVALGLGREPVRAQGFAGLGMSAEGFAPVVPGRVFSFPADLGAHPAYRIEWWYVTANLADAAGTGYGAQWTLFRQAMKPGAEQPGWADQQVWMGHAAVTRADAHKFSETFARGGVGQAGVTATPFQAWIDAWQMRGLDGMHDMTIAPLQVSAAGDGFGFSLRLDADRDLVLEGDAGYSQKSQRGQASYYFSQPFFHAAGRITIDDQAVDVTGKAWMDREWSSQPLAADQTGWDWFALHLDSGDKLMLFRLRRKGGDSYASGNWISRDGKSEQMSATDIRMTPLQSSDVAGRKVPTAWAIELAAHGVNIETAALNANSWMATSFPYWEGPIRFHGSHTGVGYLEMTGY